MTHFKVAPVPSVSSLLEELLKNKMKLLEEKKNMEKAKNHISNQEELIK
jgi:hypothetical protein